MQNIESGPILDSFQDYSRANSHLTLYMIQYSMFSLIQENEYHKIDSIARYALSHRLDGFADKARVKHSDLRIDLIDSPENKHSVHMSIRTFYAPLVPLFCPCLKVRRG
jgi:hypothetical protein